MWHGGIKAAHTAYSADNTADFIHGLAQLAGDDEAAKRYKGALKICKAVDNDRPAPGITTLQDEYAFDKVDEVKKLLGIKEHDLGGQIGKLTNVSKEDEIKEVLAAIGKHGIAEQEMLLKQVQNKTNITVAALKKIMKEAQKDAAGDKQVNDPSVYRP